MGIIKHIDVYEDPSGWTWKITESNDDARWAIAHGPVFKTKPEAMKSMFGLFFGDYDESFLTLYAEWNPSDGLFPEPVPTSVQVAGPESRSDSNLTL